MYPWLVFLHVIALFGFIMSHGVSVSVAFALRKERNPDRIQTLLNLSGGSIGILNGSILIILLTGIVSGFIGQWWGRGWIWLSLGLLLATSIYMAFVGSGYYGQVRKAIGLAYMENFKGAPAGRAGQRRRTGEAAQPVTPGNSGGDRLWQPGGHHLADEIQAFLTG